MTSEYIKSNLTVIKIHIQFHMHIQFCYSFYPIGKCKSVVSSSNPKNITVLYDETLLLLLV